MLYTTLFISCSNTESDEEIQMQLDNQELKAENPDTGGENPLPPPPPPTK